MRLLQANALTFTCATILFLAGSASAWALVVTPRTVVDRILEQGREARAIQLEEQGAYTAYYNALGLYDFTLQASARYEDSRLQSLSGGGNLRDKTTVWSAAVTRRLPTGTTLGLAYSRAWQDSLLRPGSTNSSRGPNAAYELTELTVTQDLLGNFFGIAERQNLKAAEQQLASSHWEKKEKKEKLVLDSLNLFWDTYVARENLGEAKAQKEKYEALVREVERKSRLGFSSPGDLPKAKAEAAAQLRNLEQALFTYERVLQLLKTALRMEEDLELEVSESLPPLPEMRLPELESLRSIQVNQTAFDSASLSRRATQLSARWPDLKLVGGAAFSGLDASKARAFSAMTSAERPRYCVGLELSYRLFSRQYAGSLNGSEVTAEQAYNRLLQSKEDLKAAILTAMDQVRFTRAAALAAEEETKQWDKAVKAQERLYNQGRLDFSQLIQDYNRYYQARSTRIRAVGNYYIALHSYAASVDELVK